jgi:predicted AlkP superfamily pyrophosphatase or phosphodiesterase
MSSGGGRDKVLLIVIDGCRPGAIVSASTPTLDGLIQKGSHSFSASTVSPPFTLPAHFSIFSSCTPIGHNVLTNTGKPDVSPDIMTIFEVAKYNGLSTAAFYSWEHLRNLTPPSVLDQAVMIRTAHLDDDIQDKTIVEASLPLILSTLPDFCFIFLEGVDIAGHKYGWMSEQYGLAVSRADQAVGKLLENFIDADGDSCYNILVVSDHGGSGMHHADSIPEVLTVPWIAMGPAIRKNHHIKHQLSVLDIAPTIASLLKIPGHREWQGNVVEEMMVNTGLSAHR